MEGLTNSEIVETRTDLSYPPLDRGHSMPMYRKKANVSFLPGRHMYLDMHGNELIFLFSDQGSYIGVCRFISNYACVAHEKPARIPTDRIGSSYLYYKAHLAVCPSVTSSEP